MGKIKSLEKYTKALKEISDFKEKNESVFDEFDSLQITLQEAETELKNDVRENHKMNIANEYVRVTYSPAFTKSYKSEVLRQLLTPKKFKDLVNMGAIIVEEKVDGKVLSEAVEKGIIEVQVQQKAFHEQELAPRVSIKIEK